MSDNAKKKPPAKGKKDAGKGKKGEKGKGGKDGGASIAAHPRASAAVRRSKGFGGLLGFGLAALLAHGAGLSPTQVVERALLFGVVGYLVAWGCAVTVWRHIVLGEMRAVTERYAEERAKRMVSLTPSAPTPDPSATAAAAATE